MYTKGKILIFRELLLLCSAYTLLLQCHLKAPNHLNFSLLLYFHNSHRGHLKAPNHHQLRCTQRVRYKFSGNCFFFVLLTHCCYSAISRHQIVFFSSLASLPRAMSTRFLTYVSLVRAISRHQIIFFLLASLLL